MHIYIVLSLCIQHFWFTESVKKVKATTRLLRSFFFFFFFFFYRGFSLSRTFTIHGTAGEGGGYLFNSSLPLPPAPQRRVERKERSQRKSKTELFTLAYKNWYLHCKNDLHSLILPTSFLKLSANTRCW